MKIVIVGGVAGGASAATRLRRLDENAQIVLFERGEHISYANCGLPYYIGGFNPDPGLLIARTREEYDRMGIRTFLRHEIAHMAVRGEDLKVLAEVLVDRLRLGRRFDDNEILPTFGCF